jgi:hypothetical protein
MQKSAGLAVQEKVMSALTDLEEENKMLRERLGMPPSLVSEVESVQSVLQGSKLSDLVGGNWKGLVVSGLADMEHRLLVAEEGWRKLTFHSNMDRIAYGPEKLPLDMLRYVVRYKFEFIYNYVDEDLELSKIEFLLTFATSCVTLHVDPNRWFEISVDDSNWKSGIFAIGKHQKPKKIKIMLLSIRVF